METARDPSGELSSEAFGGGFDSRRLQQGLPADVRAIYRTAWELPMRSLVDMAIGRGAFIDQRPTEDAQSIVCSLENSEACEACQ